MKQPFSGLGPPTAWGRDLERRETPKEKSPTFPLDSYLQALFKPQHSTGQGEPNSVQREAKTGLRAGIWGTG